MLAYSENEDRGIGDPRISVAIPLISTEGQGFEVNMTPAFVKSPSYFRYTCTWTCFLILLHLRVIAVAGRKRTIHVDSRR